jgi:gluconokinase
MDVLVGLDAGTTSTKAVTAGADAVVRDAASVGYPLLVPAPGRAELDAQRLVDAGVQAITEVVQAATTRGDRVVGMSISTAMHGLVPMDEQGAPLGPLVTWADSRAAPHAAALRADGRAKGLHARTGTPVHPMSPMVKLAWWSEHEPDLVRSTARWGGVKELLLAALCGCADVVDLSCASATGAYDLLGGRWDAEALEVSGVREEQLAQVVPTTTVLDGLRPEVARATGLPVDLPVVVGASDGALANLGTGAVRPDCAAVSLGTSGALRVVVPRPLVDPEGRLFCYALTEDHWIVGGAVNNGGSVVRWASLALAAAVDGEVPEGEEADALDARLLEEAAHVPAGSEGLLCLPYLLGERAPWWREGLQGAYIGLRRDHRRPHLVRAAVEGVCQQLALVRDALASLDLEVAEVRATGGAVESPLWLSVLGATLDLPVRVATSPEGTGLGAVLLGLHALGELPDLGRAAELVRVHDPVQPDAEAAGVYRRLRPLVEQSALALTDVFTALQAPGSPGIEDPPA